MDNAGKVFIKTQYQKVNFMKPSIFSTLSDLQI